MKPGGDSPFSPSTTSFRCTSRTPLCCTASPIALSSQCPVEFASTTKSCAERRTCLQMMINRPYRLDDAETLRSAQGISFFGCSKRQQISRTADNTDTEGILSTQTKNRVTFPSQHTRSITSKSMMICIPPKEESSLCMCEGATHNAASQRLQRCLARSGAQTTAPRAHGGTHIRTREGSVGLPRREEAGAAATSPPHEPALPPTQLPRAAWSTSQQQAMSTRSAVFYVSYVSQNVL